MIKSFNDYHICDGRNGWRIPMLENVCINREVHEKVLGLMIYKGGTGHLVDFVLDGMDMDKVRAEESILTSWIDEQGHVWVSRSAI